MTKLTVARWLAMSHRPLCLDIRSEDAFLRAHLPGAGSIPLAEIPDRIHELPRRGAALFVLGGPEAADAFRLLAERKRWDLSCSVEAPETWPPSALIGGAPSPLWSPSTWLEEHWDRIPTGGRVLDVAMGSGRNAVFLARQGFAVEGEDILPEAVAFAAQLAARNEVAIDVRQGDLKRADAIPVESYDGILVFSYLDRALFPSLAQGLRPGGVLIYETFLEEQARRVGRPRNPDWLLKPGELAAAFSRLEILDYRECNPEPDRWVASLVARRPL